MNAWLTSYINTQIFLIISLLVFTLALPLFKMRPTDFCTSYYVEWLSLHFQEVHQGVVTDRRHSLKRGDRLSKKERQTTASDWEKATNYDLCYGSKVTATFITIKQATKQLQNE
jgi:hypothetical protein